VPHNPGHATPDKYQHATGLGIIRFRSPLLTESHLFSSPTGTKMFHFPAYPPTPYELQAWVTRHNSGQVTPFGNPGITARLTTPPGISQPPTSFIGPWCQGIHTTALKHLTTNKMLATTIQISTNHQPPPQPANNQQEANDDRPAPRKPNPNPTRWCLFPQNPDRMPFNNPTRLLCLPLGPALGQRHTGTNPNSAP
jgi:hypothetical protein